MLVSLLASLLKESNSNITAFFPEQILHPCTGTHAFASAAECGQYDFDTRLKPSPIFMVDSS